MSFGIGGRQGGGIAATGSSEKPRKPPMQIQLHVTSKTSASLTQFLFSLQLCAHASTHAQMHTHSPFQSNIRNPDWAELSSWAAEKRRLDPSAEQQLSSPWSFPPGSTFQTSSPDAAKTPPYFLPHLRVGEEGIEAMAVRQQQELLTAFQTEGSVRERRRPVPNHHTSYAWN